MLVTTQRAKTASVNRLLKLWEQRYTPDLSSLPVDKEASVYNSLLETASPEGRASTVGKLKGNLENNCQMAWVQSKSLYTYIPNILDLNEARRITQFAFRVYRKVLEVYQQQTLPISNFAGNSLPLLSIPAINELAYALEPTLLIFQEQHMASKDWRSLGFMTTQLNFTNKLILKKLTAVEQALFAPYLKFVEEQVAMPWQRVCTASAKHELGSPAVSLVEQMLPASDEISQAVYQRLMELLPNHRSRRGMLNDSGVTHSCLRDLNMFQAYLWLCLMEKTMAPLEGELLSLCAMVVEGVGIKWEMTEKWCQVLADEVNSRVPSEYQELVLPYTEGMKQAFFEQRTRLGCAK